MLKLKKLPEFIFNFQFSMESHRNMVRTYTNVSAIFFCTWF